MSIDGVGARLDTTTQPTWFPMSCAPSRIEPPLLAEIEHCECEDHEDDGAEADEHGRFLPRTPRACPPRGRSPGVCLNGTRSWHLIGNSFLE